MIRAAPLHTLNSSTPCPLVSPTLLIKILWNMGSYKGRTNVKHRKRRSAKAERIKAVSASKETEKKTA